MKDSNTLTLHLIESWASWAIYTLDPNCLNYCLVEEGASSHLREREHVGEGHSNILSRRERRHCHLCDIMSQPWDSSASQNKMSIESAACHCIEHNQDSVWKLSLNFKWERVTVYLIAEQSWGREKVKPEIGVREERTVQSVAYPTAQNGIIVGMTVSQLSPSGRREDVHLTTYPESTEMTIINKVLIKFTEVTALQNAPNTHKPALRRSRDSAKKTGLRTYRKAATTGKVYNGWSRGKHQNRRWSFLTSSRSRNQGSSLMNSSWLEGSLLHTKKTNFIQLWGSAAAANTNSDRQHNHEQSSVSRDLFIG